MTKVIITHMFMICNKNVYLTLLTKGNRRDSSQTKQTQV